MICIVVFVSLVQRVSCCHCSAQHYDGDGGGSVPRKPSMYVSYSATSEAIEHVSMRSATTIAIEGYGRHVVVRNLQVN